MGIGRFGRGCLGTSQSIKGSLMRNVALSSRFDYLVTMAFLLKMMIVGKGVKNCSRVESQLLFMTK